jgi:carbohydrate diacid regulator
MFYDLDSNFIAPVSQGIPVFETRSVVPTHVEQIVTEIAQRVSELLRAQVLVVDEQGLVLAWGGENHLVGPSFGLIRNQAKLPLFRFPVCVDGWAGELVIGEPSNGEIISPRLAQALVDLVVSQTALHDRLPNQQELKDRFIHDLLHDLIKDEGMILRQAKLLRINLAPPRAVILIDAADYIMGSTDESESSQGNSLIERRAQFVVSNVVNFFQLPSDTICAYLGNGEVAVLKASDTKNLVNWADNPADLDEANSSWANLTALKRAGDALLVRLGSDTGTSINIGIGRYHPGIWGLARSYQDARAALSLGRRFNGHNQVYCLNRLGMAAFVGIPDEQTKVELATYLLSPLDEEEELFDTLGVFFAEDCSPSATASRLTIHRNTLGYRLDKVTSLTGLDPRKFDDAVQIRLALLLRSSCYSPQ